MEIIAQGWRWTLAAILEWPGSDESAAQIHDLAQWACYPPDFMTPEQFRDAARNLFTLATTYEDDADAESLTTRANRLMGKRG